ncbi:hypothetical protein FY136_10345 [Agrobacterium tumefaciens]|uniref:hypothetical protein n=1 Tax=Agrobacterium tumefaciens TaxID=358 RepID=UPI0021CF47AD|nr:hypothetical protein [Agrobacterium tumefaciens]UXT49616.1 hypothetical protein FY136_10345 [Agrobacterium tumefaciens]
MSNIYAGHLTHLNSDYVCEAIGDFYIEEKDEGGQGKAFFSSENACIIIRTNPKPPLLWALQNRKCADGAFVTFNEEGYHLHLVELKSRLTQAEWSHVLLQFEGMYLTSLAACRLMNINSIQSVNCYIAFKRDKMAPAESASPILLKQLVGKDNPLNGHTSWVNAKVSLPFKTVAVLHKGQRDTDGNADFRA